MSHQSIGDSQPTLVYLMTDVAGSTRLWESNRGRMARSVALLDEVCEQNIAQSHGSLLKSRGEGDSHFGVFTSVDDALTAAVNIYRHLGRDAELQDIVLRAGIHAGSAEAWAGDYYGPTINRCARIRQVAQPGQILVSEAVQVLGGQNGKFQFRDLGIHRLKDLMQPERLFQLVHPELRSEFATPETLTALSHNLPCHLTSFVGRDDDIARLHRTVMSNRLTTVTGAGGVGKTKLSLLVAAECIQSFKEGAWFIDLAQTHRPESVLPILCSVLEVSGGATEPNLLAAIEHRQVLLILDNCEHLFEECRRLSEALLNHCPSLRILATSRRVLDVRGEQVYKLGGLSLPDKDHFSEALKFDGTRLFIERAKQRDTGLTVSVATLPGIVDLCSRIDGLPLAIEMVASLTDVLTVSEISASIADYLDIPISASSDDPRQRTISSTIEWSRRLLSPEGQRLLGNLAIFPGTWTLEAARLVCLGGVSRAIARDRIKELVDHSLVFTTRTTRDALRFGLLQTTREVVTNGVQPDQELFPGYVAYFRSTIESAREFLDSGEEAKAHELIDLEWEPIIKALELSYASSPIDCATMALGLHGFWMRGSRMPEGKAWYERLSTCMRLEASTRVAVQIALSTLYILLGENDHALQVLIAAEQAVRNVGGYDLGKVIGNLAVHHDRMGRYEESKPLFEQCCQIFNGCGAASEEALSLLNLGVAKLRLGEPLEECAALYHEALVRSQAAGLTSRQAKAYSCLAHIDLKQGRIKVALERNGLALNLWRQDPNIPDVALTMVDLAVAFLALDQFESAARSVHVAERMAELSHSPFPSLHVVRLEAAREAARSHLTNSAWRAHQRATRSKTAQELITMAVQTVEDADLDVPLEPKAVIQLRESESQVP